MVDLAGEYDANAEATTGFEPLPAGQYVARIVDAKKDPVSRRNDHGDCLNLTWRVSAGDHEGRLFWQRINLWFRGNNEAKTREVANREFAAIREATGVSMPQTTDELLERDCTVTLKIKKDEGYDPKNVVSSVKALEGTAPAPAAGARPAPAPAKKANPFAKAAGR